MNINTRRVKACLQNFEFRKLFVEELNWAICNNPPVQVPQDGLSYCLTPIAQQGGMYIYLGECYNGQIPPPSTRRAIENRITKLTHEHMIIFTDKNRTCARWQWVKREQGQSAAAREFPYYKGQTGEPLLQKLAGIAFDINDMDEEGRVAITRVTGKVAAAFDIEAKITKRFYDEFDKERKSFLAFLSGLKTLEDNEWYVSVMLNRLMFIYFIQKISFLNNDRDYLNHKLAEVKKKGKDLYYAKFLISLFFEGFAKEKHTPETIELLGDVPYLNGGIFQKHKLEEENPNIAIPDAAFDRIFNFFNKWDWHLDYRPLSEGNEINPDVLGYIFEQYINRKQMGAYYTKEDITGYICKNTIIPALLDKLANVDGIQPRIFPLKDIEPYIYQAVKQEEYLPTETDREYIARQERYRQIKADFAAGKIGNINDLITYNLDIQKFAYDWARNISDPTVLRAFYFECLSKITILDPTVGSGAFLFAALNILEPLYEICLEKMRQRNCDGYPRIAQDFTEELQKISKHPNRKYFILKSIVVNNLYGVDIMEEAVEICKLRLFLKLAAQVEDSHKMEPLPDIDFNIRAGNSLVGYANEEEIKKAKATQLDLSGAFKGIEDRIADADRTLKAFRNLQTKLGIPASELAKAKVEVKGKLAEIQKELDRDLAAFYGSRDLKQFVRTHQPFHWIVEFYGIIKDGGFDVIIGNPPYVEYSKVKQNYTIKGYKTESCGNLYAFLVEKCFSLLKQSGLFGVIIPMSSMNANKMTSLQTIIRKKASSWISHFAVRPSKLFVGAEMNLVIIICNNSSNNSEIFSTRYMRWASSDRENLFTSILEYVNNPFFNKMGAIPKLGTKCEISLYNKMFSQNKNISNLLLYGKEKKVYFHSFGRYWRKAILEELSDNYKEIIVSSQHFDYLICVLNSQLIYWYWIILSDCYRFTLGDVLKFPINLPSSLREKEIITKLAKELLADYENNSKTISKVARNGVITLEKQFYPQKSKEIIDKIDRILADQYGFTEEELDFIINYDIKYRMGKDNGEEEEE